MTSNSARTASSETLWNLLRDVGVTHVVGLPDTETGPIFARQNLSEGDRVTGVTRLRVDGPRVINVCREGEALGIVAGLWAGGAWPVVLIQSTGVFESGDALRSFGLELEVPLDLLIGWRGQSGKPNAGYPDTARDLIIPTLDAWRIPYDLIDDPDLCSLADLLRQRAGRERGVQAYLLPQ